MHFNNPRPNDSRFSQPVVQVFAYTSNGGLPHFNGNFSNYDCFWVEAEPPLVFVSSNYSTDPPLASVLVQLHQPSPNLVADGFQPQPVAMNVLYQSPTFRPKGNAKNARRSNC